MILHQLKQYLGTNLRYGENSREKNQLRYLAHLPIDIRVMLVSLSLPDGSRVWGVDISHWNMPPVNLKRMVELYGLQFVIIKGCDGSVNSRYYNEHKAAAKEASVPWGMYVWLYPNGKVSLDGQVGAWHTRFSADPPPMGLFIDAEWTTYAGSPANPNAADLRGAHDRWRNKAGQKAITYTAQAYANTYLQGFDWTREELWIANYGVSTPGLPSGASGHTFWQFTSTLDGKQLDPNGNAELDGNYFNGTLNEFRNRFGGAEQPGPAPEPDVQLELFDGQAHYEKRTLDKPRRVVYHLAEFDVAGAEIIVSTPNAYGRLSKKTILDFMNETGCDIAVNADEPYYFDADEYYLKRRSMSKGIKYGGQNDGATVSINRDNSVTGFSWIGYAADCYNAISGSKILLSNGVSQPVDDSLPPDPRTVFGWNGTRFYWLVIDGRSLISGGMTALPQVIESQSLIKSLGARNAVFLDGGGSSAMAIRLNGQPTVVNMPSDGTLRDVGHYIGIKFEGVPMPTEDYYEYTATGNRAIRVNWGVKSARIPSYSDLLLGKKAKGAASAADRHIMTSADIAANSGLGVIGDVWVRVYENDGKQVDGWTALTHSGVLQLVEKLIPAPTPEPEPGLPASFEHTLVAKDAGGKDIATYKGTLVKQP